VTAWFLKELLRRALLESLHDSASEPAVTAAHTSRALDDLLDSGQQLTRSLLGVGNDPGDLAPVVASARSRGHAHERGSATGASGEPVLRLPLTTSLRHDAAVSACAERAGWLSFWQWSLRRPQRRGGVHWLARRGGIHTVAVPSAARGGSQFVWKLSSCCFSVWSLGCVRVAALPGS
jgi:hypothetical protein